MPEPHQALVAFVTPSIMAIVASTDCTNVEYRLGTKKNIEPAMLSKNKTSTELISKNKTNKNNKQALIQICNTSGNDCMWSLESDIRISFILVKIVD